MSELYKIDPELNIPIYQQLVDVIRSNIKTGRMRSGMQLPTVRDLAGELGVAMGTVKRTYDELEDEGLVEKAQGRGTFVCYTPIHSESRKERAMAAIDRMFEELDSLGLPDSEINIFLNLKMREHDARREDLKVAVVECNPECLMQVTGQIRELGGLDIYSCLLDDVKAYPYKLSEEVDLIITSMEHSKELRNLISDPRKIARIAIGVHPSTVAQIVKIRPDQRVGILCESSHFGSYLQEVCDMYADLTEPETPVLLTEDLDAEAYLGDKDAVLIPFGYENYCGRKIREALDHFRDEGDVIECRYVIDAGSMMYLKERIDRIR